MTRRANKVRVAGVCAAALLVAAAVARADDAAPADQQKLLDRIKQLEDKVNDLEGKSTQVVMQASVTGKSLDFLNQVEMSGFVSASYLYDFSRNNGATIAAGRLFDANNNSFTVNKFKLALEKPVSQDPTNWNAGFRTDLIFGQDAALIHSGNGGAGTFNLGTDGDLEQAFVDFNIPIGTGLKVSVGKMVSLMGVEVIEEVSNPNLSEGNQFIYVENFTQTGLQLAYQWTPVIDTEFIVCNGWDTLPDNNESKSYFGRLGIAPDANTTIGLLGYTGPEQAANNHSWRKGAEIVVNRNKLGSDKLNAWLQLDCGMEDQAPVADGSGTLIKHADWCAAGAWATYDFTDKVELALRADYLRDKSGVRTPFGANSGATGTTGDAAFVTTAASFTTAPKELYGLTATVNYKPFGNLQVRPELRWDRATSDTAFNGKRDQVTAAMGVAYLF